MGIVTLEDILELVEIWDKEHDVVVQEGRK